MYVPYMDSALLIIPYIGFSIAILLGDILAF